MCVQASATGSSPVYVVDEVGKMELLSSGFHNAVSVLLRNKAVTLLATIPVKSSQTIPLVEEIRCHPDSYIFEVGCMRFK
jgi:nucleoside-triphosphatase THEP1